MSDVVNMFDPNKTTVEGFEDLLQRAKNGQIKCAITLATDGNDMFKAVAGTFDIGDLFKIIGLLETVKTEIALSLMEDAQEVDGE
jgi:hypothetical protein